MKKLFERTQVRWDFWLNWVLASTGGVLLGLVSPFVVGLVHAVTFGALFEWDPIGGFIGTIVNVAIVGAVIGASQWLVLRRKVSQVGWWVLASAVGLPLGLGVASRGFAAVFKRGLLSMHAPIGYNPVAGFVGALVSVAIVGAAIGAFQWLVLRRKVPQAGWWVLASAVGPPLGLLALGSVLELADEIDRAFSGLMKVVVLSVCLVVGGLGSVALPNCITGSVLVWLLPHHPPDEAGAIEVA